MLYEAARHEPLCAAAWDAERARRAIQMIVDDAETRFDPRQLWPVHPLDHTDLVSVSSYKSLYVGAAGVIWALGYLRRAGAATVRHDWTAALHDVHHAYLEAPDSVVVMPSYLLGEAGIFLLWWRQQPSESVASRLLACIREMVTHPANELMLGAPGGMLAALFMHEWAGDERWRRAFLEGAEALWAQWMYEPSVDCWLWTQLMFGQTGIHVGAVHGAAGNLYPLLRGARFLSVARRGELYTRAAEILKHTALVGAEGVNWPQSVVHTRPGRDALLVQWCHGSPGMIGGFRHFPIGADAELEALLARGGDLVWRTGPLEKGSGLCHGTAGNGYALLELHRRTADARWLARARAFAMHAILQSEQMRTQYGQGRYSLWTGDAGVAVFLWHCIRGEGGFPSLDVL